MKSSRHTFVRLRTVACLGFLATLYAPWRVAAGQEAGGETQHAAPRVIRGVVLDLATGAKLAGVRVSSPSASASVVTDGEGRYELPDCRPDDRGKCTVDAQAAENGKAYFPARVRVAVAGDATELEQKIQLYKGTPLRGRVVDAKSNQPVTTSIQYFPLSLNPHRRDLRSQNQVPFSQASTADEGTFTIAVLPGPGVLAFGFSAAQPDRFMPSVVGYDDVRRLLSESSDEQDLADDEEIRTVCSDADYLLVAAGGEETKRLEQAAFARLELINPAGQGEPQELRVALERAITLRGRVLGPDGEPLDGATVYGLHLDGAKSHELPRAEFTVLGLNPRGRRALFFYHRGERLGLSCEIRGDAPAPLTVTLGRCGSVVGRLLDLEGVPLAGRKLRFDRARAPGPGAITAVTDAAGRYRADRLVPHQVYRLSAVDGQQPSQAVYAESIAVEAGEEKNLGDARVGVER